MKFHNKHFIGSGSGSILFLLGAGIFFLVIILPGVSAGKDGKAEVFFSYLYQNCLEEACNRVMPVRRIGLYQLRDRKVSSGQTASKTQNYSQNQDTGKNTEKQEIFRDPVDTTLWESRQEPSEQVFLPHTRQFRIDWEQYQDYEKLVKDFYTIDASTYADSALLDIGYLLEKDMTLRTDAKNQYGENAPSILIYHTHSLESFIDSDPDDPQTRIVGVGERLAEILRTEYGYSVLHCTESFDAESRDRAYSKALPYIEQLLLENPSIQVVIDLHRDDVPMERGMTVELDGVPTAKFMFFNGLSRLKNNGEIAYLENDNLKENLAFSFQLQAKCEEYYPGLTRKIYLKGYRYNMHLKERSLLVELGSNNNTLAEAMNACNPLAHVLHMVLQGE